MIFLHKLLPIFLLPTGITLILLLAGLWFKRRWLIGCAIILLSLSSMPIVSHYAMRAAENYAQRLSANSVPQAGAIVVLSGGRVIAPGAAQISEWGDANRFFGGVELFKAGKSPWLIFTGGWSPGNATARLEGDVLSEYAQAFGVPAAQILTTKKVVNTEEEAQAVAALFHTQKNLTISNRKPRILLITSAFHMPRAKFLFEQVGLEVVSFPVDFKVSEGSDLSVLDFLPSAAALAQTETAWRELYGRLFYLIKLRAD